MWRVERDGNGKITGLNSGPAYRDDGTLITDPEPLPDDHPDVVAFLNRSDPLSPLTPRQLAMMLVLIDTSEADIEKAIKASISAPQDRALALAEFRKAQRYARDHWLVNHLAAELGFEPHELDALWGYAAEL